MSNRSFSKYPIGYLVYNVEFRRGKTSAVALLFSFLKSSSRHCALPRGMSTKQNGGGMTLGSYRRCSPVLR